ncbi:hypothetical protein Back2_04690 [Nocardioides baekrokdamisoli]|uniref:Uncharacterized protein n=1 Tax=Nocardioides baekrokdamisoli TaxID=1804624 RepID=A0A3G9ICT3_9ACTN|nr:hypothetical protein [Nocardioides baekrokdamisoli]BBH16182.1 hypothetical protein Back2_04690 [Nocardioides baekrokdamisoli]
MSATLPLLDRLRIERLVWSLDQQLYDLPRATRISTRREVRTNLTEAAQEVGASQAIRNVGSSRQLAEGYLTARFGDGPRHSWIAAVVFLMTATLVATSLFTEIALAYARGVSNAAPHMTGTLTYDGLRYFQNHVTYTFTDGHETHVGGGFSVATWLLLLFGTILVGRLWRAIPALRRR